MTDDSKTKDVNELPKTKVAEANSSNAVANFFGFENLRSLAMLILLILAVRSSVISPYHVPTASMEPTIKVGDRLLALKLAYNFKVPFTDWVLAEWGTPKRGDIIVFKNPRDPDIDYVKRVVGIAGDRIQLKEDVVYINGEKQPRTPHDFDRSILEDIADNKNVKELYRESLSGVDHWVMQNTPAERRFSNSNWPPDEEAYVVPADSVFVMGDNRDNSQDSRVWHEVPLNYIRGKALFVLWSAGGPPDADDWFKLRWTRFGHIL